MTMNSPYLLQVREITRLDNLGIKSPLFMFGFLEMKQ